MTYLNYNEFIAAVSTKAENTRIETGWRYGQAFFNCLYEEMPDIADRIQATQLNPFYKNVVDTATYQLIREIYEEQAIK